MNYTEVLEYIHSLGMFGLPAGLERIKDVLKKLGNPQNKLRAIHIAGTNGKGSVSAMISSVLSEAGYKTGLFVSPYIIDFRERIQINGEFISEENLTCYAIRVKETDVRLTEFEFITAMAFLYFAEQNIDILVCETGLGGRFDATNTLDNLACAVLTRIGLDHTGILGETIEEIAFEKCGILREAPTVTTPYQDKRALAVIKEKTNRLIVPKADDISILKSNTLGNTFIYKEREYEISLCGEYQIENAVTAIEAVSIGGFGIDYNIIYKGLKKAFIPARLEKVSENPLIIIDGAHNPDGADVLSRELKKFSGEAVAVIGMMKDKAYESVLEKTLRHCKFAVTVSVENMPRSLSGKELCKTASEYCECKSAESYDEALRFATEKAGENPVFVFGSLYLAADIRKKLK